MTAVLLLGLVLLLACAYIGLQHRRIHQLIRLLEEARSDAYRNLAVGAAVTAAGARDSEAIRRVSERRVGKRLGQEERRANP